MPDPSTSPTKRVARLTELDLERADSVRERASNDLSRSETFAAALAHYGHQLPIEGEALRAIVDQLELEQDGATWKVTSFTLSPAESGAFDDLVRNSDLPGRFRFSANGLLRVALLMISFADDASLKATCAALPARAARGRRPDPREACSQT